MEHFELPLVFFTVFTQWGIGALFAVMICQARSVPVFMPQQLKRAALCVWLVTVVGSLASIAHLGTPTGAPRALFGLAHSWLSREVVAFFVLNALVSLWLMVVWFKPASRWGLFIGAIAAVAGGAAILVSSQVYYQIVLHPLWHTFATQMAFIGCALLLGFVSIAVLVSQWGEVLPRRLQAGALLGIFAVVGALIWRYQLAGADGGSLLLWWQLLASIAVSSTLLVSLRRRCRISLSFGALVMVLIVSGEVAGRMLFYSNVMKGAPWF